MRSSSLSQFLVLFEDYLQKIYLWISIHDYWSCDYCFCDYISCDCYCVIIDRISIYQRIAARIIFWSYDYWSFIINRMNIDRVIVDVFIVYLMVVVSLHWPCSCDSYDHWFCSIWSVDAWSCDRVEYLIVCVLVNYSSCPSVGSSMLLEAVVRPWEFYVVIFAMLFVSSAFCCGLKANVAIPYTRMAWQSITCTSIWVLNWFSARTLTLVQS